MNPLAMLQNMSLGPTGGYQELLTEEQLKAARQHGMLGAGAAMMAGGGWSPQKRTFGQQLGQGLLGGMQMQGQAMNQMAGLGLAQQTRQQQERELEMRERMAGTPQPYTLSPGAVRFDGSGNPIAVNPARNGGGNARDLKIQDYVNTFGMSRSQAMDIVDNNLSVTTSPNSRGEITVTNARTGESWQTTARQAREMGIPMPGEAPTNLTPGQAPEQAPGQMPPQGPGRFMGEVLPPARPAPGVDDLVVRESQQRESQVNRALSLADTAFGALDDGIGMRSIGGRMVDGTLQFLSLNSLPALFADKSIAAGDIKKFNQFAKSALVNNPRFPMGEQAIVGELLPNPDNLAANPEVESIRFLKTVQALQQARENDRAYVEGRQPRFIQRDHLGTRNDPALLPQGVPVEQADQVFPPGTFFIGPDGYTYEVY